ncbi:MAG: substrate-binding domain-containing protein [Firmicutes bacterium]|nr:substrate-binding domain-containing protein [Bacillota bacterium]
MPRASNRLTLGFITYHEDNDNHNQMMAGIFKAAQKHDADIIRFSSLGRDLSLKRYSHELNTLFAVIKGQNLDGLLFLGWSQIIAGNPEEYVKYFDPIPLFSLGHYYDNIPNIFMDGMIPFKELLLHLINVHHCRRIAYVAPVHFGDSRVPTYIEVMQEFGIYDPLLLVSAPELRASEDTLARRGKKAVSILLDERQITFDAIASSYNDETVCILEELKKRGFQVPDDVKIIGYEDDDSAKYATPPITTIYYPFWELGYHGCERFIELLTAGDGQIPFSTSIPGRIILRRSCGCISNSVNMVVNSAGITLKEDENPGASGLTTGNQHKIHEQMRKFFPNPGFDLNHLLSSFFLDFQTKSNTHFLRALEEQTVVYLQKHLDASGIEDLVSNLRRLVLPYLADLKPDLIRAEDLFHQGRIIIAEKATNLLGYHGVKNQYRNQTLYTITQEMMTTFNIQKLMDVLELSLPRFNIPSCYLFLFNEGKEFHDSTPIFQYINNRRIEIKNGASFSFKDLIQNFPRNRRYSWLVYLLSVNNEYLGVILFEPGLLDEQIYFTLSVLISTALKGAILIEKLENTNLELKNTQQELVDKAHQAGMADIATGTLHNIGNVLNSINTSIHLMKDIIMKFPVDDYRQANELLRNNIDDLENFIIHNPKGKKLMQYYLKLETPFLEIQNQLFSHLNRLVDRINLVNEIIMAQQNYAGFRPIIEETNLSEIVEDALKMEQASFEKHNIKIIKNFEKVPKILIQRAKLLHILVNLFNNAKDAMQDTQRNERKLIITIDSDDRNVYLRVMDTGHGIPPELVKSIFAYGFTTKQDGHGFGLHSCANYMAEMGGKIWAESPGSGGGATFILQFGQKNEKDI